MTENSEGFLPVAGKNPRILILGSFPGVISLEKHEYYGNKRNHFWKIMEEITGIDSNMSYEKKTDMLKEKGIALWDVLMKCKREGSSDNSIKEVVPNDIESFLQNNPTIKCIVLNGKSGAGKWFKKTQKSLFEKYPDIEILEMVSTSPANALYSFNRKKEEWIYIKKWID
ncbi:DNA-deoxyinosine glycosylase [Methanoplanus sp. FWC-SCC4]|uniref:DNA-deoxyinosine glycosylase n=1 Tax=Methanochimaera problematica TaxID=2609417 RepID=A0AA97FC07_9EURY|nr:DNA-deoxyinosine glycosylase [Methanoplanus sp. FWC-SCC4]WOF16092.1 DNA-deoxyinosine glycosylase [Methanoplanus sp. FWC-SCC4]